MKKLEMKDLTEAEKAEIALLLQKAQANADHQLTNGERNKIREEGRLKIVADRAEIVAGARRESEGIIKKAVERARAMVDHEEIVRQAQQKAAENLTAAQQQAREMRTTSCPEYISST